MSFINKILGRPIASGASKKESLSIMTAIPALGLDALSSTAYGPEAALAILLPLGIVGLHYFFFISCGVVATLLFLYFSYRQTIAAYPNGGGAYIVASDNLGLRAGLWAAVALMLDYLLNVAVGISAGVGALVSAIPALQPYTLTLCLSVLLMLTILNLRGIRQTGFMLIVPTLIFVTCIVIAILIGLFNAWQFGGNPHPIIAPPSAPPITTTVSMWLLLGAFANGLTAMTGVEAVSNAVPLFSKPTVKNAQLTLTVIVAILGLFLLALGYLCPTYHIIAMDETQPGYQTILSQLVAAVAGKNVFYYTAIISIFLVLMYSAQTSFTDFPRVCRLLAEDHFLPHVYADQGSRLVYSQGIIVLAILSAILLIVFEGITFKLIPLFAVGAFSAFLFSQTGMIIYWLRHKHDKGAHVKLVVNTLGAVATAVALMIITAEKFIDGAWIIVVIAPLLVLLFTQTRKHYKRITREINKPLKLQVHNLKPPVVIIPIHGWNRVAEKAVRFGLMLSDDVTALHVKIDQYEDNDRLKKIWIEKVVNPSKAANSAIPKLEIVSSPYRQIYKPILSFVKKMKCKKPDRLIAVVIPELVEPHWYEYILHNLHATGLRTRLFLERDQRTVVMTTPWYLHKSRIKKSYR